MTRYRAETAGIGRAGIFIVCCALFAVSCVGSLRLEHRVLYTERGTEEETSHGFLLLNEYIVPDVFAFVQQDGASWIFRQRVTAGPDGYHAADRSSNIRPANGAVTDEALKRGWYVSETCLSNTPSGWLYVLWRPPVRSARSKTNAPVASAFVAPSALSNFIAEHRLIPVPRTTIR